MQPHRHPQQPPYQPPPPPQVIYVRQGGAGGWATAAGVWVLVLVIAGPILAVLLCCGYLAVSTSGDPDPSPTVTSTR